MTRWTCSTTLLGGLLARADRAGTLGAAADLPGLDLAAQGNATALSRPCWTRWPAACRRGDAIGRTVPSKELAAAVYADRLC